MLFSPVRVCVLAVLVIALEAPAQHISLADFAGRGATAVRNQLVNRLCGKADCLAATKVTVGGRFDPKKAQKEALDYFVTGAIAKRGKQPVLELVVLTQKGTPKTKRVLPLDRSGLLSAASLDAAGGLLKTSSVDAPLKPAPPPPSPPVTAQPAKADEPINPIAEPKPTEASQAPAQADPPADGARSAGKRTILSVELGLDVLNRQLRYFNVAQAADADPLRQYEVQAYAVPTLKLELYPLARSRSDALVGLGVEGSFGLNPLLKSHTASSSEMYPTIAMNGEAALRWRLVPSQSYPFALALFLGFRVQAFTVELPSAAAPKLMPNFSYLSLRAGLAVEIPVVRDLFFVVVHVSALPVFSAGDIISSAYFKSGTVLGFEGSGGLRLQITRALHLVATFEISQYQLTFTPKDGDRYVAAVAGTEVGAVDRYIGGNISVRFEL